MAEIPFAATFILVPSGPNHNAEKRLKLAKQLADETGV
jgi:hypothetical protein